MVSPEAQLVLEDLTLGDIRRRLEGLFIGKEFIPYENRSNNLKKRRTIRQTLRRIHKLSKSFDINDIKLALIDIINQLEEDSKEIFTFERDIYEGYERVLVCSDDEVLFWVEVTYEYDEEESATIIKYITITDDDKLFTSIYEK